MRLLVSDRTKRNARLLLSAACHLTKIAELPEANLYVETAVFAEGRNAFEERLVAYRNH